MRHIEETAGWDLTWWPSSLACLSITAILSSSLSLAIEPTWRHTGPSHGKATAMVVDPTDPTRVYAATSSGIFRSLDGGAYWKKIQDGDALGLVVAPKQHMTLDAIADKALLKSLDGGESWGRIDLDCAGACVFHTMAIDPVDASTLYAGFSNGLKKSYDAGLNWGTLFDGTNGLGEVLTLAIDSSDPQTLYAGIRAYPWSGVYRSEDGGQTWARKVSGLESTYITDLVIDPDNSAVLYAVARKVWGPVEMEGGRRI